MRYWRRIVAPIIALPIRTGRENRGRGGRGVIYRAWYRTATGNTSSAPALQYWYQTSTTTLRTMESPRECVSPLLLQQDRFFQSSKTTNSSGRMLCNKQAVFEKVQDNDSTKNAIFESNIFPFTHESIRLFYFVTI